MDELELKKEKLKALLEGKNFLTLNVEEAKKRLRQTDPGIDINIFLEILNNPSKNKLPILLIEIFTDPEVISYFAPILKFIIIKFFIRE